MSPIAFRRSRWTVRRLLVAALSLVLTATVALLVRPAQAANSVTVYYRPLTYGVISATIVAMIPLAFIMTRPFMPWG